MQPNDITRQFRINERKHRQGQQIEDYLDYIDTFTKEEIKQQQPPNKQYQQIEK